MEYFDILLLSHAIFLDCKCGTFAACGIAWRPISCSSVGTDQICWRLDAQ